MAKWDIDPPGVQGVVTRTATAGSKYEEHHTNAMKWLEDAAKASGSGLVAKALGDFAVHAHGQLGSLSGDTARVLQGAVDATVAYIKGDLTMAAEAQNKAVNPPRQSRQGHSRDPRAL